MRFSTFLVGIFLFLALFGAITVAQADEPTPTPNPTPQGKGFSGPLQIVPGQDTINPATDTIIRLSPLDTGGEQSSRDLKVQEIGTASITMVKFEDFESIFPNEWDITGGNRIWTDVPCFALDGFWSGWPAGLDGAGGFDPCAGANYPPNASSWLVYGPFSLADADFAFFDFFYRLDIEQCNPITDCDYLFRGVSLNGNNFSGSFFAGNQMNGPYNNGYNLSLLDLDNVPGLGNVVGQPNVWVGFHFVSDDSVELQGPFIDNINVGIWNDDPFTTYLPIVMKTPTQKTILSVWNNTSNTLQSYVVKNVTLNNTPIGDISCPANIPSGQTRLCGTFDSNSYQVTLLATQCPNFNGGTRSFNPGSVTAEVRCPSK